MSLPDAEPPAAPDPPEPPEPPLLVRPAEGPLIVTVGHLAPGVETMVHAMALLRTEHPDLRYEVVGHTHPEIARRDGERFRWSLEALVDDLGLTDRVRLVDRAPAATEHADLVARARAVLVPYRFAEHATSRSVELALLGDRPLIITRSCVTRVPLIDGSIRWIDVDDDEACAAAVHEALVRSTAIV